MTDKPLSESLDEMERGYLEDVLPELLEPRKVGVKNLRLLIQEHLRLIRALKRVLALEYIGGQESSSQALDRVRQAIDQEDA